MVLHYDADNFDAFAGVSPLVYAGSFEFLFVLETKKKKNPKIPMTNHDWRLEGYLVEL